MEWNRENFFLILCLFFFFTSVYLASASVLNFLYTDAGELRYEVAKSIIENHNLTVPEGRGVVGADGRSYSWLGIGSALLALPFYLLGKIVLSPVDLLSVMNQFFASATAVLVFIFCRYLGYSKRTGVLVAIFYGLGTFAWPLAKQPFDHPIETFFVLLAVFFVYLYTNNKKKTNIFFSSFFLGLAFLTRTTSILVIPPLFLLLILSYRERYTFPVLIRLVSHDVVLFATGFSPFIILMAWYNYYRFGSILETGYQLIGARLGLDFFGGTPLLTGLGGLLVSPGKGYFFFSPVAILSLFSMRPFLTAKPRLAQCFLFLIISYLVVISKNMFWHGDWAWGPRYLLVVTPFLLLPVGEIIESQRTHGRKYFRSFVLAMCVLSLLVQVMAVSVDFWKYFYDLSSVEGVPFVIRRGEGVQPITVPPPETYFDWRKSQLVSQANSVCDFTRNALSLQCGHARLDLRFTTFDFWWVYRYALTCDHLGFVEAFFLIIFAAMNLLVVFRLSKEPAGH